MTAHILIIENHPDSQKLMAYLLERSGYHVSLASTGEAGIEIAMKEEFHLILCDICMVGINGFEVARRLKATSRFKTTPLIAITAMIHPEDHDQALAAGFDGYVTKTTAPQQFIQQVQSYLLINSTYSEKPEPNLVPGREV